MNFSKYAGCGNDFILIDNRTHSFPNSDKQLILDLCHRKTGVGADGVILLENSSKADYKMRIFNADGSEAEMCGNGIRCLFKFIQDIGIPGKAFHIETMHSILYLQEDEENVKVEMPIPKDFFWNLLLENIGEVHYLNTGVPHVIYFTDILDSCNVTDLGRIIRFHPTFSPKGTNVNFVQITSENTLSVRTYERGVEEETLACGTGATAAAVAAAKIKGLKAPLCVKTLSRETLKIDFNSDLSHVTMTGPAIHSFNGIFKLNRRYEFCIV